MHLWQDFHGPNAGYVVELYERYCQDPQAVDPTTRAVFAHWQPALDGVTPAPAPAMEAMVRALHLAQAIREHGSLAAHLDPFGRPPSGDPRLTLVQHGLHEPDLQGLAARFACAYRARFHKDFLIDLVGYRRHGHNEGDAPRFTQPLLYQAIDRHPTVRARWAGTLLEHGTITAAWPDDLIRQHMASLHGACELLPLDVIVSQTTEDRPVVRHGEAVVRPMMYVALTYDHRLVDGRESVQFLVRVKELIEDPEGLLLEG